MVPTPGIVARIANNILGRRLTMIHQLSEVYTPSITKQKEEIIERIKEKAESIRKSELARKVKALKGYYTVEMSPPLLTEKDMLIKDIKSVQEFVKKGRFPDMTVREAWMVFLVGLEVFLWFFIGETIAKGRIVGYVV